VTVSVSDLERLGHVEAARGMRISDVECLLLSYRYPEAEVQRWSGGVLPGVTLALVRVTTDDGVVGLGETYAGNFAPEVTREIVRYFRPFLIGEDPSRIGELWHRCYSRTLFWGRYGITVSTLGAIESALWDLCGNATGKPVVELLGGSAHATLRRYASGGMEGDDEALRSEQQLAEGSGFSATKIRGGDSPEEDGRRARIAREALPAELGLALDAVQGSNPEPWDSDTAIRAGRELEPIGLIWFEEPCASTDPEGYAACRRALDIPIAGGESCTTIHEFRRFFELEALDIVQPDAAQAGGILEMRKIAAAAERSGVRMAVHSWLGAGSVMANYHVGFASPNCDWLEFPTQPNPFVEEMLAEPLEVEGGRVASPQHPGLGIRLPEGMAEKYAYEPGLHYHFEARRGPTRERRSE
jgi:L-alanine-DL-glutamate epimerase-like enolase superfamily enzyme